jgi:peptidoglycan/LPS O-acetylase OafA/YrhL
MQAQKNNFDLLRFIGATLVLFGHSFVFLGRPEPLAFGWLPYGPLGVYVFFTISGFLIVKSWNSDPCWYRFLTRRALRIFPALAVCILLTLLVLGPALTTLPLSEYFRNPSTYLYLFNIVLLPIYSLPGVFTDNTFPNAVNGSLWSLPLEFALYLSVAGVGLFIGRWRPAFGLAAALALILLAPLWAWKPDSTLVLCASEVRQLIICGAYFYVGGAMFLLGLDKILVPTATLVAIVLMMLLQPWIEVLRLAGFLLIPVAALSFALAPEIRIYKLICPGDYSYGIYIYAFPIQQTLAHFWPQMNTGVYIVTAFALTLVPAVLSWHLIEKKALALKPKTRVAAIKLA